MRKRWFLEPASRDVDSYVVVEHEGEFVSLKVADCDRNVKLWFYTHTKADREAARRKVERLRKAIDLLEQEIEKAIAEREAQLELKGK